jgi:hypothetical protein
MIDFSVRLRNPFPCQEFRNIWCQGGKISDHKYWELQLSRYAFNWFELRVDLNWRQTDHAGPWLTVNLFGFTIDARIVDSRHWDDGINNWAR